MCRSALSGEMGVLVLNSVDLVRFGSTGKLRRAGGGRSPALCFNRLASRFVPWTSTGVLALSADDIPETLVVTGAGAPVPGISTTERLV
jgi:hypothetical protein